MRTAATQPLKRLLTWRARGKIRLASPRAHLKGDLSLASSGRIVGRQESRLRIDRRQSTSRIEGWESLLVHRLEIH